MHRNNCCDLLEKIEEEKKKKLLEIKFYMFFFLSFFDSRKVPLMCTWQEGTDLWWYLAICIFFMRKHLVLCTVYCMRYYQSCMKDSLVWTYANSDYHFSSSYCSTLAHSWYSFSCYSTYLNSKLIYIEWLVKVVVKESAGKKNLTRQKYSSPNMETIFLLT